MTSFSRALWVLPLTLFLSTCRSSSSGLFQPMERPLPDVQLVLSTGDTLRIPGDLKGHWTVLGWIYTSCPDVCPLTARIFQTVRDSLRSAGISPQKVQLLLVSFDPEMDTLPRLAAYASSFRSDDQLRFAGGTPGEILTLSEALSFHFKKRTSMQAERMAGMRFAHDVRQYLINPDGIVVGVHDGTVAHPIDPDSLYHTLRTLEAS